MHVKKIGYPELGVVNIQHRHCFNATVNFSALPTLTTSSMLWDFERKSIVPLPELFLAQGFAYPSFPGVDDKWLASVPFMTLMTTGYFDEVGVKAKHWRTLIGNSMHFAQVGGFLIHVLGRFSKAKLLVP